MKNTFKAYCIRVMNIIALVAVIGFSMAACDNNKSYDGNAKGNDLTINIAYLRATFPVLSFALNAFEINRHPTFINIERKNTLNYEKLPDRVERIPNTSTTGGNFWTSECVETAKFINTQYNVNKDTKFNIYVCDFDLAFIIYFMVNNNIPESNYTVTTYIDGTGSYDIPRQRYAESNAKQKFSNDVVTIGNVFNKARAGENWQTGIDIRDSRTGAELSWYSLAIAKYFNNVTLVFDDTDALLKLLPNIKDDVQELIYRRKIIQKDFSSMIQNLKSTGKVKEFEYLLKLRWGDSVSESIAAILDRGNTKKTLMILGTNTPLEEAGNTTYGVIDGVNHLGYSLIGEEGFIKHVITKYGNEYNLFYKGHPGTPTTGNKKDWLDANGIPDILATIPAETIMYLYDNVYIGGYPGSTFQSALQGQCIVSFGSTQWFDSVVPQADLTYFTDTKYMYKNSSNELVVEKRQTKD